MKIKIALLLCRQSETSNVLPTKPAIAPPADEEKSKPIIPGFGATTIATVAKLDKHPILVLLL